MIIRTLKEIVQMTEGFCPDQRLNDLVIKGVSIDSKTLVLGNLFVPIVRIDDGHKYVRQAFEQGASVTLWQKDHPHPPEGYPVIFVDDTLQALQKLAAAYRQQLPAKIIGVTGSNGKTTVKDMLGAVLSTRYNVHKTVGNLNGEYGLPLTLLEADIEDQILILEMGMSEKGEMKVLSEIARPDMAIITMVGVSHLSNLGSREEIAKAKLEILAGLHAQGILLINGDEPLLTTPLTANGHSFKIIKFGEHTDNDYFPIETTSDNAGMSFRVNGHKSTYHLPLLGEHNIINALPAIAVADLLGLEESDIREGLSQLKITPMRMEQIQTIRGFTIINDAWNASPISMRSAISSLHKLVTTGKKVLVLGDMLELGDLEAAYHAQMSDLIRDTDIDVVFTYGRASKIISDSLANAYSQDHIKHFTDKIELANACLSILKEQDIVLFKASRGMKLEEVCDMLK